MRLYVCTKAPFTLDAFTLDTHDHQNKKSMNGRKIILGFKFILHKIKAPRDH